MSLSIEEVTKIAKLARIEIKEEEKANYAKELNSILGWVEQLAEVEVGAAADVASVIETPLPMRSDTITDGGYPEQIVANAPKSEYGCFVVPKVIDQG